MSKADEDWFAGYLSPREEERLKEAVERQERRRRRRKGIGTYQVVVREPTAETSYLLRARFPSRDEAIEFVKETSHTYPEDTLLFVTGEGGVGCARAFIVNKWGEAIVRKKGWVPKKGVVPTEHTILPSPESIRPDVLKDFCGMEVSRVRELLHGIGLAKEAGEIKLYEELLKAEEKGYVPDGFLGLPRKGEEE